MTGYHNWSPCSGEKEMRSTMPAIVRPLEVQGFESYALENQLVRVVVIPSLGGRVWEILDRIRDRQWIWHREGVDLAVRAAGSTYDDAWAGGWEQLFPNDAPSHFEGRALPDHGELWTTAWDVVEAVEGSEAVLRLTCESHIRRTRWTKVLCLGADSDTLHVHYRIESLEQEPFHFLFKEHLPVAISADCRLALPGGRVTPVDPAFGTLLEDPIPFNWPGGRRADGHMLDLGRIPSQDSNAQEFVYVSDLLEGWCGVDDLRQRASLRLVFDRQDFPFVWLFLAYGGWQGCYTAVLEPCSNMPKDLAMAVRTGISGHLSPGGVFRTRIAVTLRGL